MLGSSRDDAEKFHSPFNEIEEMGTMNFVYEDARARKQVGR